MSDRTDLICEFSQKVNTTGITHTEKTEGEVKIFSVAIDKDGAEKCAKPAGKYVTLSFGDCDEKNVTSVLSRCIAEFTGSGSVMVCGLGNADITPDSLGAYTVRRVVPTKHFEALEEFNELGLRSVTVIEAGVLARTGIESAERIRLLTAGIKPDCVIVIDSLACSEQERLCSTIQLTDTGIAPGSGVTNSRCAITPETVGTRVLAIGVPTVIDYNNTHNMVTPRNIDAQIRRFSRIISKSINNALNPVLSDDEIRELMM